jgi:hypothetical protein
LGEKYTFKALNYWYSFSSLLLQLFLIQETELLCPVSAIRHICHPLDVRGLCRTRETDTDYKSSVCAAQYNRKKIWNCCMCLQLTNFSFHLPTPNTLTGNEYVSSRINWTQKVLIIIIISLLMSPLLEHRRSLWITLKENGP